MFISRVLVDQNNRQKLKSLTHLGAYHHWVEQSFPEEVKSGERLRHLWRLDSLGGQEYLLVVSENRPDLDQLAAFGVPGTAEVKDYEPFLASLHDGQRLRFRLTANPTYSVSQSGKARGRVYPHVTAEQQSQWLSARAEKAGFTLSTAGETPSFTIVGRSYPILRRKQGRAVRISRVTYEGRLTVTDIAQFQQTLRSGIGRERAYGMGMMTVIPEA
ncbi:type I-E CRISPR-associated protein Cas6/Cse3/CasE [Lacticaseibacillus baoqingensis]|uniref:Type I-E CRISPR-associated protein Cas6/Cse3/CasE n=1 Tax=Lacticaseibacillus baoqingensis TaxID=2486013 RepID=A0ABW4E8A4_9LACO|nr:type I-E CRISPR-associated protein Cas6/Cse3/CasE [Lacticaseibacillus baoqingensis]